jgi:hypothetical protein
MNQLLKVWVGIFCVVACWSAFAASSAQTFRLPGHGTLILNVPDTWRSDENQSQSGPPTIKFEQKSGPAFVVLISAVWGATPQAGVPDDAKIRSIVASAAKNAEPQSLEGTLAIQDLQGGSGHGYYFKATDKAPPPGEFKYLVQGMVRTGAIALTFTILTNDNQGATAKAALELIRSAVQQPLETV